MPQKELTPHQVSKGISYVHKEAPFLARLKNKTQGQEEAKKRFLNYEDGQDDDDYNELDGAQVVELDAKGKDVGEKEEEEKEGEEKEEEKVEEPAVDENGRLLFRKTKKQNTKRKLQQVIDDEIKKVDPKKNKKKKKQSSSLLSFQEDEE
ncbi:hypothetical protein G6F56_013470 [Rhizopus delemar]|nr:hypothetical protein G6F56_013470 [Rhizopus delemar]